MTAGDVGRCIERRFLADRRGLPRIREASAERRAARVEAVYAAVPMDHRNAAKLSYEHVRLVLTALDFLQPVA